MQEKIKLTVELPRVFASLSDVSEKALPGEIEKLLSLDLVRWRALTYNRAAELLGISQAEFISYLSAHGISIFRFSPDELLDEVGS